MLLLDGTLRGSSRRFGKAGGAQVLGRESALCQIPYRRDAFADSYVERSLFIAKDFYSCFEELAIYRAYTIRPHSWKQSVLIYQVKERDGGLVDMPFEDYWHFIVEVLSNAVEDGMLDKRFVFPGHRAYETISISKLPSGLADASIARLNSWLIMPFTLKSLKECYLETVCEIKERAGNFQLINSAKEAIVKLAVDGIHLKLYTTIHEYSCELDRPLRCAPLLDQGIRDCYALWIMEFVERFELFLGKL